MFREITKLQKLAIDCYYGNVKDYSQSEGEDVIRKAFLDVLPDMPERKSDLPRYFKSNSNQFFALLEQTITPVANRLTLERFGDLVQMDTVDLGDKPTYRVKNNKLFKVSQIATGVGATHRQRIHDRKIDTEAFRLSAKIYEEAFEFLTGKINWTELCNRVADSFAHKTATLVTGTIFAAYDKTNNPLHAESNADGLEVALQDLINKVEGMTGVKCQILGTKGALAKVPNSGGAYLQTDLQDRRDFGYVKIFDSNQCVELAQYYDEDAAKYEIPNDTLLILPSSEKIAYVCVEGDVEIVNDDQVYNRKDRQIEMEMERQLHVGVAVASTFGMLKLK